MPALTADVKAHKAGKGALECAVCLSEFDDDETLRLLPKCSHVFHPDCIDTWLASHVTCPVCRTNLAVGKFLNRAEAKSVMGARGDVAWAECSDAVGAAMHADVMRSVVPQAESVLRRTRVLLYQGVCDLRNGVVSTEAWLAGVRRDGLRAVWRTEDGELAGYVQRSGALVHVVVYGAGHLVPADNGRAAQEMIEGWVLGTGPFCRGGDGDGTRSAA